MGASEERETKQPRWRTSLRGDLEERRRINQISVDRCWVEPIQGTDGTWRSAQCGCRIMRGYFESCPECVEERIAMAGNTKADRGHPLVGWFSPLNWIWSFQLGQRRFEIGFWSGSDFNAFDSAFDTLHERCELHKPKTEHWIVAIWRVFGGKVECGPFGIRKLRPLNCSAISRKIPRLSLTPDQVRRRLARVREAADTLRERMQRGLLLPESCEERRRLERRLWEENLRRRVLGREPLFKS